VYIAVPVNSVQTVQKVLTNSTSITLMRNAVFTVVQLHTETVVFKHQPESMSTVMVETDAFIAAPLLAARWWAARIVLSGSTKP